VLFRNEEQAMRVKMIEQDWVEAVIGMGPNLFYNSSMESTIVVCSRKKPALRKGKVLFIDAVGEVARERTHSYLKSEHQERVLSAYQQFSDVPGFARVATTKEIVANAGNLSIQLYVKRASGSAATSDDGDGQTLSAAWSQWQQDGRGFWQRMQALSDSLEHLISERR
jgi:type I restriction enzyme M protein